MKGFFLMLNAGFLAAQCLNTEQSWLELEDMYTCLYSQQLWLHVLLVSGIAEEGQEVGRVLC